MAKKKYIIKYKFQDVWYRSGNKGASGVFTNLARAEAAADKQERRAGGQWHYRVFLKGKS